MAVASEKYTPCEAWLGEDLDAGVRADLQVERDEHEPGRVAIHTMIDGTGSHASLYLDREAAIYLVSQLLDVIRIGE